MTTTEASALASHAEQPELTPTCKVCGATKVLAAHSSRYVSRYWVCKNCKARKQREVYRAEHIANQPPPICSCGATKSKQFTGKNGKTYWYCKPCRNVRQKERYHNPPSPPVEAVSVATPARAAAEAVRQRRLATPFGGEVMEHLKRERRLGIGKGMTK